MWLSLCGSCRRARAKRPPLAHGRNFQQEFPAEFVSVEFAICTVLFVFLAMLLSVWEPEHIVLEWLPRHFHIFRGCLIRGRRDCECQRRNGRNRLVKCAVIHSQNRLCCRRCCRRMKLVHAQPLLIWSASNWSVQHLRVLIDAVDHSESFSVDLGQCSCFMGKFVTPGAEQSFCNCDFLVAVCKSAIVSLFAALVCEATGVEPHRRLLAIVTKVPVSIERDI